MAFSRESSSFDCLSSPRPLRNWVRAGAMFVPPELIPPATYEVPSIPIISAIRRMGSCWKDTRLLNSSVTSVDPRTPPVAGSMALMLRRRLLPVRSTRPLMPRVMLNLRCAASMVEASGFFVMSRGTTHIWVRDPSSSRARPRVTVSVSPSAISCSCGSSSTAENRRTETCLCSGIGGGTRLVN